MSVLGNYKKKPECIFSIREEMEKGTIDGDYIYAVLDGSLFMKTAHANLLHKKMECALTYTSIKNYINRFINKLKQYHVYVKCICFNTIKDPRKLSEFERRHNDRMKNRGMLYRWEFDEVERKKVKFFPMTWTARLMFQECCREILGSENVLFGGKAVNT